MASILKIGHRGASGYEPENTLSSFRKALELGVNAIELDVHLCRTGEIVVIHDETVDRTTNGSGLVAEMSLEELRKFDAGNGQKIPTLAEVLRLVKGWIIVNIELKAKGTAKAVSMLLRKYRGQFLISSFDHQELKRFHQLHFMQPMFTEIRIGLLVKEILPEHLILARDLDACSINVSMEGITAESVAQVHKQGLEIFVWTVNNPEDIKRMKELGVDGIFSDYPDRL